MGIKAVALGALLVAPGCSFLGDRMQTVRITPSDPMAEVLIDGEHAGYGPMSATLDRRKEHEVLARLGGREARVRIMHSMSDAGAADLVGGVLFLLPLLGIFGDGFYDLDPRDVQLAIPPEPPIAAAAAAP